MEIDLTSCNYTQLSDLKERIGARMLEMRETGVVELRAKFIADAAALGLGPEDIFMVKKQRRRRRSLKHDETLAA